MNETCGCSRLASAQVFKREKTMIPINQQHLDAHYMAQALELAQRAGDFGEVPVGALLVLDDVVLGRGYNRCVIDHDPSAHAEIIALREGAHALQCSRLDGATLYVTLEPCLMCCGALLQARIARLVFGAREPRTGGVVSIHDSLRLPGVDHHIAITDGIASEEATLLMRSFFQRLR